MPLKLKMDFKWDGHYLSLSLVTLYKCISIISIKKMVSYTIVKIHKHQL